MFSFSCFFLHDMEWRKKQEKENKTEGKAVKPKVKARKK